MTEPAQVPWKDVIQISSIEVVQLDKLRFVNFFQSLSAPALTQEEERNEKGFSSVI